MKPVSSEEASDEIRTLYNSISKAFGVQQVPLFFAYLANYPTYFTAVVPELLNNFEDKIFHDLTESVGHEMSIRMKEFVPKSSEIGEWLDRYKFSPSMYHTRKTLLHVHRVNTSLAFVFLALREAVKGWAVAAPKLAAEHGARSEEEFTVDLKNSHEDFIYEDVKENSSASELTLNSRGIIPSTDSGIEQHLYVEYLRLCQRWYSVELKKENYLYYRVISEEVILRALDSLPHPVFSPINRVIQLVPEREQYIKICYLLSEHFPTTSVQRMLFSGYMCF